MVKNIFVVLFLLLVCGATVWLVYDRTRIKRNNCRSSLGVGLGSSTSTPTPTVGDFAMQDVKKIVNPSGESESVGAAGATRTLEGGLR